MSIGFQFTARAKRPEKLAEKAAALARERGYGLLTGESWLRFTLCPMGELALRWEKETQFLGQWAVTGECCSTPCGAGFHKAAVELLDSLGRGAMRLQSVDDETGYYEHRDFEQMKEQHFYPWLRTVISLCGEKVASGEYSNLSICWNLDQYQPEEIPGTLITPMGRFEARSLVKAVQTLGIRWLADRFFLWDRPERDARFYRNTALNLLWEECCFAPSSRRESDARCNRMILDMLEKAARLDPGLSLPVSAYREVCALDGREPVLADTAPELEETFPIGFRKGLVTHFYGVLQLTLPGDYLEEWEEDKKGGKNIMWWNGVEESVIWRVTGFRKRDGNAEISTEFKKERDVEHLSLSNGTARWGWYPLDGEEQGKARAFQVYCEAASGPSLFLITATYFQEEEKEAVYELLRRIRFRQEGPPTKHTENYDAG